MDSGCGAATGQKEQDEEEILDDTKLRPPPPPPDSLMEEDVNQTEPHSGPGSSTPPPLAIPSSTVCKELLQVEVELRLLEALEIYHPAKLQGLHRHFILYGLMEYLERRLNHRFSADEILELLDRFYNLEFLKPNEDESEFLTEEEEFSLPASILAVKEEMKENS